MAEKTRKTQRARRKADNSLWIYATIPIAISLIGVVIAFLIIGWQVVYKGNEQHGAGVADERADAYQAALNSRIDAARQMTVALADAPSVRQALTSYQADRLAARGAEIGSLLDQAARVDLIARGSAEVDLNADVPISFAALDLIKRAETQPFVGPEIALNHSQFAYVAAPITVEGVVQGVLFVALKTSFFYDALKGQKETGLLEVKQHFGGGDKANTVLQHGNGDLKSDSGAISRSLSINHWRLTYIPGVSGVIHSWFALLTPFALITGLILGGVLIGFTRFFKTLEADASQLTEYASRVLRGRSPKLEPYKLALIRQVAESLKARPAAAADTASPAAPAQTKTTPTAKAAATEADEDDAEEEDDLIKDLDAAAEEDDFLDVTPAQSPEKDAKDNFGIHVSEAPAAIEDLDPTIFRAYDIRGIVSETLTEDVVYYIGRAFASEARALDQLRTAVGRDGRASSPVLRDALVRGLTDGGLDVIDVGEVPTPLLYYATYVLDTGTGIMITGSHNPADYNGLKMMLAGETLAEERIQKLRTRIEAQDFTSGSGGVDKTDLVKHYTDRVLDDVAIAQPLKVVVDCGNGVAGLVAPALLEEMGCEVVPLYCDVDGTFPNHHPDPADPKNLEDLITVVKDEGADLGIAFDGDGDRLGLVTNEGTIIWPDKLLMLFARDIVGRNPGADIVYDVKCSRHLNNIISEFGGRPIMWKTGHSHIKGQLKETGALLGGEFSGHICFAERWYGFDDAIYSAARLMEIISSESETVERLFASFPTTFTTPEIKVNTTEDAKFAIMEKLAESGDFGAGALTTIDGIRVDYEDGWGLIRPSNTSPVLTLRFEGDSEQTLARIEDVFRKQLAGVEPSLTF